jgi:hypothetical protein
MNDTPTLVKFHMGWVENGIGKDGLPLYKDQLMIVLNRPPLLRLERAADENDVVAYPQPYAMFEKEQTARKTTTAEGYPLAMWPACGEAEFRMLADRDIVTVEQLAKLAARGAKSEGMPAEIKELAERAAKLIAMQGEVGKFEQIIRDKDGQIEALREQVDEAVKTIASQKTLIDRLRISTAV